MSSVYNASIEIGNEEHVRTVIGTVAAAAMKLKNYGYSDEGVYEILPLILGIDVKADPSKLRQMEGILEAIHELDSEEEMFIRRLRKILGGRI